MGPILQGEYNSSGFISLARALHSGQMRYPGGTVANYWYWPNATYASPCQAVIPLGNTATSHGVGNTDHNYCTQKAATDALPAGTYSAANFMSGYGMASPQADALGPVWDVNVLTVDREGIFAQLYDLHAQSIAHGFPVTYLEFGNELFLTSHYDGFLASSTTADAGGFTDYLSRVRDALPLARSLFPNAKLAAPMGWRFCSGADTMFDPWNTALAAVSNLFDAVTIHEYTACDRSVNVSAYPSYRDKLTALSAWGEVYARRHTANRLRVFGASEAARLESWYTEWSTASWSGGALESSGVSRVAWRDHAISGVFFASYLLAMAAPPSMADDPNARNMNLQLFNFDPSVSWGKPAGLGYADEHGAYISAAGQIFSHVSETALVRSDAAVALNANGAHCGALRQTVEGRSDLACVQAVAFTSAAIGGAAGATDPAASTAAVIAINRCSSTERVQFSIGTAAARSVTITVYDGEAVGSFANVSSLPTDFAHPWGADGPLQPTITQMSLSGGAPMAFAIPPLSLSVVALDSPPPPAPCVPCTNTPSAYMTSQGQTCTSGWEWMVTSGCSNNANWMSARYCESSCAANGVGYGGVCCPASPPPPPPTPPPPPCMTWCASNANSWSVKCGYATSCAGCAECYVPSPPPPPAPPTPPPAPWSGYANLLHVDAIGGSDSNAGSSPSDALATIREAVARVTPNTAILVASGTYTNHNYGNGGNSNPAAVSLENINDVLLRSLPGHTVRINFDGSGGIICRNVTRVEVRGFIVDGPNAQITEAEATADRLLHSPRFSGRGIVVWGGAHVWIHNNTVSHCPNSGIRVNRGDYCTVSDNEVFNNTWWSSNAESAIVFAESAPTDTLDIIKMRILRNRVYGNKNIIPYYNARYDDPAYLAANQMHVARPNYGSSAQTFIIDGSGVYISRNSQSYTSGRYELSDNVCYGNGINGVVVHKTNRAHVYRNTLDGNGVVSRDPPASRQPYAGLVITNSDDVEVVNK